MPEQLLHHAHVGPSFEQMRREGVSQVVRGDGAADPGGPCVRGQQSRAGLSGETPSPRIQEERSPRSRRRERRTRDTQIVLDRDTRHAADGDVALFVPLPEYANGALLQVEVVHIEPRQLGDAQARSVQELEDRAVAHTRRTPRRRGLDHGRHLVHVSGCGRPRGSRGRTTPAVGSSSVMPSRSAKRCNVRTADSVRATLVAL